MGPKLHFKITSHPNFISSAVLTKRGSFAGLTLLFTSQKSTRTNVHCTGLKLVLAMPNFVNNVNLKFHWLTPRRQMEDVDISRNLLIDTKVRPAHSGDGVSLLFVIRGIAFVYINWRV